MANIMAHLLIAERILEIYPNLITNKEAYFLGVIAPDTIGSKENATKEDKKIVHLRQEIKDIEWLNCDKMLIFNNRINEYIESNIKKTTAEHLDFNIGYLIHLWTDEANHRTIRQTMLKKTKMNNIEEKNKEFFQIMTNDLEALDQYLLDNYNTIPKLLDLILTAKLITWSNQYVKSDYILKSILWIKNYYLVSIAKRKLKYLSNDDIEIFIKSATNSIVNKIKINLSCIINKY